MAISGVSSRKVANKSVTPNASIANYNINNIKYIKTNINSSTQDYEIPDYSVNTVGESQSNSSNNVNGGQRSVVYIDDKWHPTAPQSRNDKPGYKFEPPLSPDSKYIDNRTADEKLNDLGDSIFSGIFNIIVSIVGNTLDLFEEFFESGVISSGQEEINPNVINPGESVHGHIAGENTVEHIENEQAMLEYNRAAAEERLRSTFDLFGVSLSEEMYNKIYNSDFGKAIDEAAARINMEHDGTIVTVIGKVAKGAELAALVVLLAKAGGGDKAFAAVINAILYGISGFASAAEKGYSAAVERKILDTATAIVDFKIKTLNQEQLQELITEAVKSLVDIGQLDSKYLNIANLENATEAELEMIMVTLKANMVIEETENIRQKGDLELDNGEINTVLLNSYIDGAIDGIISAAGGALPISAEGKGLGQQALSSTLKSAFKSLKTPLKGVVDVSLGSSDATATEILKDWGLDFLGMTVGDFFGHILAGDYKPPELEYNEDGIPIIRDLSGSVAASQETFSDFAVDLNLPDDTGEAARTILDALEEYGITVPKLSDKTIKQTITELAKKLPENSGAPDPSVDIEAFYNWLLEQANN